jgi:hypothetical protein
LRTNEFQVWFITEQLAGTGIEERGEAAVAEEVGAKSGR